MVRQSRYVRATCPSCGTVQAFDKAKICGNVKSGVLGADKSKSGKNKDTVFVVCQNPDCRCRFKLEIDCRGY